MTDGTYEMVLYRLKPHVAREQFLEVTARAAAWLRNQPGYIEWEHLEDEGGQQIDLLLWASLDEALAAGQAFIKTPQATAFMELVEEESVRMMHPRRVASYGR
jgi:quinol monooxygenase YgiN